MSSDEEGAPDVDDQDEDVDEGDGNAAEDAQASPTRHNLGKPSATVGSQRPLSPPNPLVRLRPQSHRQQKGCCWLLVFRLAEVAIAAL